MSSAGNIRTHKVSSAGICGTSPPRPLQLTSGPESNSKIQRSWLELAESRQTRQLARKSSATKPIFRLWSWLESRQTRQLARKSSAIVQISRLWSWLSPAKLASSPENPAQLPIVRLWSWLRPAKLASSPENPAQLAESRQTRSSGSGAGRAPPNSPARPKIQRNSVDRQALELAESRQTRQLARKSSAIP